LRSRSRNCVARCGEHNALSLPEPGAWALLMAGLGGLSMTVRRRRI